MTANCEWVLVSAAATEVGATESRIRTAYRNGRLEVRDDLIGGRIRKLVDIGQVRAWAGIAPPPEPEPAPAPEVAVPKRSAAKAAAGAALAAKAVEELATRMTEAAELAERALDRSARAEQQVVFLRNELAQLKDSHSRVQAEVERRSIDRFRETTRVACTEALQGGSRRRSTLFFLRRTSA